MRPVAVLALLASAACVDPEPVTLRCARFDGDDVKAVRDVGVRAALFPSGGALALVRNDTLVREELRAPPPPVEPAQGTPDEALLDMWDRSDASYALTADALDFGVDRIVMLDPFDVPRGAAPDDPAWAELRATHGDAPFVVECGPVGFSCDDDAVFVVARVCGVGCTSHRVVRARFVDGVWRVASLDDAR